MNGFGNYGSAVEMSSSISDQECTAPFRGVVRAKGKLWLANAHTFPIDLHVAGKHIKTVADEMPYLAALNEAYWGEDQRAAKKEMVARGWWQPQFGDRMSEVVFIGVNLNKELIADTLQAALLTQEESDSLGGVDGWRDLEDPFFDGECARLYFDALDEAEDDAWSTEDE